MGTTTKEALNYEIPEFLNHTCSENVSLLKKKKKAISRLSLQMLRDVCLKKKKKSPLYYKLQIYSYLYLYSVFALFFIKYELPHLGVTELSFS